MAVLCWSLAACGSTPKKATQACEGPQNRRTTPTTGRPRAFPPTSPRSPTRYRRDEPFHRYANQPYTVFGQTYVPVVNKEPRRERGIASWYGKKFHGQKTSSGEPYDMFAMTAAHPTLPIPSYARVTNVKNGQVGRRAHQRPRAVPLRPHHRPLVRRGRAHRHRRAGQRHGGGRARLRRRPSARAGRRRHAPHRRPPPCETPMVVEDRAASGCSSAPSRAARAPRSSATRRRATSSWNNEPLRRLSARRLLSRAPRPLPQPRRSRRHRRQGARDAGLRADDHQPHESA